LNQVFKLDIDMSATCIRY